MNKKIIGIFICMLFLFSTLPTIQGAYNIETINHKTNWRIFINKGGHSWSPNPLEKYRGFYIEVAYWDNVYIRVNISIIINIYDVYHNQLDALYINWIGTIGNGSGFHHHMHIQNNNSMISFVKVHVDANEETLSKTGLSVGQFFLFFIRNFS